MKILLLGGTNFIGPFVVQRLLAHNCEVAVFHRGKTNNFLSDQIQHIHGDHNQLADYADQFRELQPDVVIEMIAGQEKHGELLMSIFPGITKRLVLVSSCDVYRAYDRFTTTDPGEPDPTPLTEDSPLRDKRYPYRQWAKDENDRNYWYDKIPIEAQVLSQPSELEGTVIRLPMVYGPNDYQHRMFPYLKRMADGRPTILLSELQSQWMAPRGHVENIGEGIALCALHDAAANRVYHIGDLTHLNEVEWIKKIAAVTGWTGSVRIFPTDQLPESLRDPYDYRQHLALDSTRIRQELGFQDVVPMDEAIARTVAWEGANPPAQIDESQFDYRTEDEVLAKV